MEVLGEFPGEAVLVARDSFAWPPGLHEAKAEAILHTKLASPATRVCETLSWEEILILRKSMQIFGERRLHQRGKPREIPTLEITWLEQCLIPSLPSRLCLAGLILNILVAEVGHFWYL